MLLSDAVFLERVNRVRDVIRRDPHTDAIVVTCPKDLLWLTGLVTAGKPAVHCAVISDSKDVYVVTRELEMTNVRFRSPSYRHIVSVSYVDGDDHVEILCNTVSPFRKIAIDSSHISAWVIHKLERCMQARSSHRITMLNVSPIAHLRLVKDECELQAMKRSSEAAARMVRSVVDRIKVGMSEAEVAQIASQTRCEEGANSTTYPIFIHSGDRRGQLGHCPADAGVIISNRQLVFVEFGASHAQYHGARMHTVFTGRRLDLPPAVVRAERAVEEALTRMQFASAGGCTGGSVAQAGLSALSELQLEGWEPPSRMGYSIGLSQGEVDWGEVNTITVAIADARVIPAGATLHLIPYVKHPSYGTVGFSKCVLVGDARGRGVDLAADCDPLPPAISCVGTDDDRLDKWLGRRVRAELSGSGLVDDPPTPLVSCSTDFSRSLCNVGSLLIKDESCRGRWGDGMSSFKMLGGSYAVFRVVQEALMCPIGSTWDRVRFAGNQRKRALTIYTATDGNHGAAVAWAAGELGQSAKVFMPKGSSKHRVERVESLGGHVVVTDLSYDDTVMLAAQECGRCSTGVLVQDTESPTAELTSGGTRVDTLWACKAGYTCMCNEIIEQLKDMDRIPSHVLIQVGVGSLAAAVVECLRDEWADNTRFICVEPPEAACLHESIVAGSPVSVSDNKPVFSAGLACHTVSESAWQVLKRSCDASVVSPAHLTQSAMMTLRDRGLCRSGDSGAAVPIGALMGLTDRERNLVGITDDSVVMCINTEGPMGEQTPVTTADDKCRTSTNMNRSRL